MKKYFKYLLLLAVGISTLSSCEENTDEKEEFVNWKEINAQDFQKVLDKAHQEIALAQATYGEEWEDHCGWRAFRSYAQAPDSRGKATDSICVKIVETGQGSGCPLYTDSVSVNYIGRLHPSLSYPEGFVFDHSSKGSRVEDVFNPAFAQPAGLLTSNTVEGFTTALQEMHIGDRWLVYMPSELGYKHIGNKFIPPYSMLIFEIQLKGFYRAGAGPNQ